MNIADKKNIDKFLAIILIMLLTVSDFLFVGTSLISYALDVVNTNNRNVEFVAYFLSETNEKSDKIEKNIDEGAKLFIDVSVKQEGYFNGKITLNNSNFNLKQQESNDYISEMTSNTITLKQINAGSTITLELEIEPKTEDSINIEILKGETSVVLEGSYVNSKNIEKNKFLDINGTDTVEVDWKSSNETKAELEADVLTNSVYKVNDEEKRVVQILVNSKITENNYPVKSTEIVLDVPQGVQNVEVYSKSNEATNSGVNFNESNYKYNKKSNTLTINVENTNEENINWKKNALDKYVVTYIFEKEEQIKTTINIDSTILTYDDKKLQETCNVQVEQEIDGAVKYNIESETEIYKGKLYTGEEREYTVNSQIEVNYFNIVENIDLKHNTSKFIQNETEFEIATVYKSSKINKQEFLNLFGEDGYITIKSENGTIIANINKDTETDEEENFVINYPIDVTQIEIVTSSPKENGTLNIQNTKAIEQTNLSRETINELTGLKESIVANYNQKEQFTLDSITKVQDTQTKAKLSLSTKKFFTADKNQNLKMKVILENNSEDRDLYKDPKIKITLPEQVTNLSAKCKLLYGDGLEIADAKVTEENGKKVIEINIAGEQTTYNKEAIEGTTIVINAELEIEQLATDSEEEIILNYTNNLAKNYSNNGEQRKKVNIIGDSNLFTTDNSTEQEKIQNETIQSLSAEAKAEIKTTLKAYVGGEEIEDGSTVNSGEIVKYELTLENIGNKASDSIDIEVNIPQKTRYIQYEKNVYEESSGMTNTRLEDVYKEIELDNNTITKKVDSLEVGKKEIITYELKVDEDTPNGTEIRNNLKIKSNDIEENKTIKNIVSKSDISLNLFMINRISTELTINSTGNYCLQVKNLTNEDISNLRICLEYNSLFNITSIIAQDEENGFKMIEFNSEDNSFILDNLKANKTIEISISVTINKATQSGIGNLLAIVDYQNKKYHSYNVQEKVLQSNISMTLESENAGKSINVGEGIVYDIKIANTGDTSIQNLEVEHQIPNPLTVTKVTVNGQEKEYSTKGYKSEDKLENTYIIKIDMPLNLNEKLDIKVETESDSKVKNAEDIQLISRAEAYLRYEKLAKTEDVNHILEAYSPLIKNDGKDNQNNNNNNNENTNNQKDDNPNNNVENNSQITSKDTYTISGTAWLDANRDGRKDSNEEGLSGLGVKLLNLENNTTIQAATSSNGFYSLTKVPNGKYIVIFDYDTEKYSLTTYQADGVQEDRNSDVEEVVMNLNGQSQKVASTDTLEINGNSLTNIDIGLVEVKKSDLELTKAISKVSVSNAGGSKVQEYNDASLAKVEVKSKYLKGTTVAIEYKIKVTNNGDITEYVKNIIDYKPTDLNFNSSLNSEWYQSGEYLYTSSLANVKIEPGETKELKLILTKTMTETNTGLVNNVAEIGEQYNSLGITDIDSTTGNKILSEDDTGSANVIISVSTGAALSYVAIMVSIMIIAGGGYYIVSKKIIDKHNMKF